MLPGSKMQVNGSGVVHSVRMLLLLVILFLRFVRTRSGLHSICSTMWSCSSARWEAVKQHRGTASALVSTSSLKGHSKLATSSGLRHLYDRSVVHDPFLKEFARWCCAEIREAKTLLQNGHWLVTHMRFRRFLFPCPSDFVLSWCWTSAAKDLAV